MTVVRKQFDLREFMRTFLQVKRNCLHTSVKRVRGINCESVVLTGVFNVGREPFLNEVLFNFMFVSQS